MVWSWLLPMFNLNLSMDFPWNDKVKNYLFDLRHLWVSVKSQINQFNIYQVSDDASILLFFVPSETCTGSNKASLLAESQDLTFLGCEQRAKLWTIDNYRWDNTMRLGWNMGPLQSSSWKTTNQIPVNSHQGAWCYHVYVPSMHRCVSYTFFRLHLFHRGAEPQRTCLCAAALWDPGGVRAGEEPLLHSEERWEDHEEGAKAGHKDCSLSHSRGCLLKTTRQG